MVAPGGTSSALNEPLLLSQLAKRVGVLPADLVVAGDQQAALRRFLVARKYDLDAAEAQLKSTLAWRAQFGVTALLASPPRKRLALVRALLPANPLLGYTRNHVPVSLISLGLANTAVAARELTLNDVVNDFVVRAEFYRAVIFPEASTRAGVLVDKEVAVLDMGGKSLSLAKVLPLFKAVNAVGSAFFPERTLNILVVNAPHTFSALWALLQGFVDPRTQRKINVLSGGDKQLQVLRSFLEDEDIPVSMGGTRQAPFLSSAEAQESAAIYSRLDAWLAQCAASGRQEPPSTPPPPTPSTASPPPLSAIAALQPRMVRPSLDRGVARQSSGSSECGTPGLGVLQAQQGEVGLDRPTAVVLWLLWVATSVMFSLVAWAQLLEHRQ